MPIYKIEGGINFYDELYKSLDDNVVENSIVDVCLITNAPLEENCIVFNCNHKFNYDAIYNDVLNHKSKYNSMERQTVKTSELRCPYCRTIHNQLLPQREGYKNVHGVNFYDDTQEKIHKLYGYNSEYIQGKCNHVYKYANPDMGECACPNKYVKLLPLDGKYYCGGHHTMVLHKTIKDNKIKEKEDKKKALLLEKIKVKEEKQKEKEEKQKEKEEKQKEKEEKQKEKEEKQKETKSEKTKTKPNTNPINILDENVILLSSSSSSEQSGCNQILKFGKNKGTTCCVKIFQYGFCMRHYKLHHPVSPEETI